MNSNTPGMIPEKVKHLTSVMTLRINCAESPPPTRALPLGGGRGCWKARVPTENPDEPTRIRLAQIDGEWALRQVHLHPEGNTRLPPGEYSQNRHGPGPPVHQENPPHPPLPKGGILVVDDFLSQ